jgi:SPP1 family predicted phage head-tail adaptor
MKCCDITIGMLNQRISIYEKTQVSDSSGGRSTSWTLVAEPWCSMKPLTGSERIRAETLTAQGMIRVLMRYRTDIDEAMKAVHRGVEYQIRSIVNIEMADEWLEIMLEKGVAR